MNAVSCLERRIVRIDPLPGCEPYENRRSMRVRQSHDGLTLIDFLHRLHPPTPSSHWRAWIMDGSITLNDQPTEINQVVAAGQCFDHRMPGTSEPAVANHIGIVYEDASILVVDKPAPLPVHPSGRFNRNTLLHFLTSHFQEPDLRIAHRIDANTTGLVLFCRNREAAGFVQPQFEQRTVSKEYVALVQGTIPWNHHRCDLPIGDAAELGGSTNTRGAKIVHPDGKPAETNFEVIRRLPNDQTLVKAIPVTGRTNQIRVHLWSLGYAIVGDPLYLPDKLIGMQQTLTVDQPPMCLHACRLTIAHPETKQVMTFEQPAAFS